MSTNGSSFSATAMQPTRDQIAKPAPVTSGSVPTAEYRKDPSYVGLSCTINGYANYSRQSRNSCPVSRVSLDPPGDDAPFATQLTNNAFHSLSAVCSPVTEVRIENAFEKASLEENGDSPSIIAQRIHSLYGEKTDFKRRSKSAGPQTRNIHQPCLRPEGVNLLTRFDSQEEELRPSNFPKSVKEKTAFVEKLINKDNKEVKKLVKKPPKFEIPSLKKSQEYYRVQREKEKEKEFLFSQRLKEAEERRKKLEREEAEIRKKLEAEEEQLRKAAEEERKQLEDEERAKHVEATPTFGTIERGEAQIVELVNTSFGSSENLEDKEVEELTALDEVDRRVTEETSITVTTIVSSETLVKTVISPGEVEQVFVSDTADDSTLESISEPIEKGIKEEGSPKEGELEMEESPGHEAGREFLKMLEDTEDRIRARVRVTEEYLKETHSEEVYGKLRAAVGKGNLLIAQKCNQFRQLCLKNIADNSADDFPTTRGDLEGFWDMICIQIEQVIDTFDEIEEMKENGWKEVVKEPSPGSSPVKGSSPKKKLPNPVTQKRNSDKAKEEARKRLQEVKRVAKEKASSGNGVATVE